MTIPVNPNITGGPAVSSASAQTSQANDSNIGLMFGDVELGGGDDGVDIFGVKVSTGAVVGIGAAVVGSLILLRWKK